MALRWNSAVFSTTERLDYEVFVVTPSFFRASTTNCSQNASIYSSTALQTTTYYRQPLGNSSGYQYDPTYETSYAGEDPWYHADVCSTANLLLGNATKNLLTLLGNEYCIEAYGRGNDYMKGYGNLLVVTKAQPKSTNDTVLMQFKYGYYVTNYTGNNWVCDPNYLLDNNYRCNYKEIAANADSWTMGPISMSSKDPYAIVPTEQWSIDYCLAQPLGFNGMCQLQYSLVIMICVLAANVVKFSIILFILGTQLEPVLATIGDGIATFLETPDPFTVGNPFLSRNEARNYKKIIKGRPVQWKNPRFALRWWQAPSWMRWVITLSL